MCVINGVFLFFAFVRRRFGVRYFLVCFFCRRLFTFGAAWMDGWVDGRPGACMDGWTNGWIAYRRKIVLA